MADTPKIFPLGDNCVTVDFGNEISVELNDRAIGLASHIHKNPFPGFVEAVPAYASVSVFYDLVEVRRSYSEFKTAFDAVKNTILSASIMHRDDASSISPKVVEIAVDFGESSALDLDFVAERSGLTKADVIARFVATKYRVYMLGFLPGFAYMGEVDESLTVPRKESPRRSVPAGSVGIAGRQTGVYPLESPGGWQIIGRTNVKLFAPDREDLCLLSAGDEVRFVSV